MNNPGHLHLNPSPPTRRMMLVITGVGRSRTTMTARILQDAGLHLGDDVDPHVLEDRQMAAHVNGGDWIELHDAIMHRNACRDRWGWKQPGLHAHPHWPDVFWPNMRQIVMVRDPVAVAVRVGLAHGLDPIGEVRALTADIGASIDHALASRCPTLLVSADRAALDPTGYVAAVLAFCGIEPTVEAVLRGASLVSLSEGGYLKNARVMR